MDIEEFLSSGAFVETAQGPHFCQVGKQYVLIFGGKGYQVTAQEITDLNGKKTVVFISSDAPAGVVPEVEMIVDVAQKGDFR